MMAFTSYQYRIIRIIIIIIIIIIILFILLGCFPQTYGLLTGAPRKVKHERTNGR